MSACHTSGWTDVARTRTSTSSSPTVGLSISRSSRTSGEPYLSWTIAFIATARAYATETATFSQTDTCLSLSLVNGSRFHPPQRSRNLIPASRAIRSSLPATHSGTASRTLEFPVDE